MEPEMKRNGATVRSRVAADDIIGRDVSGETKNSKAHSKNVARGRKFVLICALVILLVLMVAQTEGEGQAKRNWRKLAVDGELEREWTRRCEAVDVPRDVEELNLRNCGLTSLPSVIAEFSNLKKLDASDNHLSSFLPPPSNSYTPFLPNLAIVFLSNNSYTQIPDGLERLRSLRVLALRHNQLTDIHTDHLPKDNLEWLILTGNKIESLPDDISLFKSLRKLMLSHNKITHLPDRFSDLENLEMLRIANNRLDALPPVLSSLQKLAWIAASGNPFTDKLLENLPKRKPNIPESELELGEEVGRGSGGVTYRSKWMSEDVAVKIWNDGGMFSDGSPEAEIRSHSFLSHPNLASAMGTIGESKGLVLRWLTDVHQLGAPPSLQSVVQDLPPKEGGKFVSFSPDKILSAASKLAEALSYMHSLGFAHGDIYLHNSLEASTASGKVETYVSDLGAAFPYDRSTCSWLEKTEVLAFGHLLNDMARFSVIQYGPVDHEGIESIKLVAGKSQHLDADQRPSFASLAAELGKLARA